MTKTIIFFFLSILGTSLFAQNSAHCGFDKHFIEKIGIENFPSYQNEMESKINDWTTANQNSVKERTLITIPVIFHIVWKEEEGNISEEQILSQLEVLNQDFRALNDQSNVPNGFLDDVADFEIEFCLATRKPDNTSTSGIIRTQTEINNIGLSPELYSTSPAIAPLHYINIWVAKLGNTAGIGAFPNDVGAFDDGIRIDPRFVGTVGTAVNSEPLHLGKTLTHELGHYFNLYHVFGISASCSQDDFVEDTPLSSQTYLNECPTGIVFSCDTNDMWMNFMNYTNDACMSMFSNGQKLRVLATLETLRFELLESSGCLPPLSTNIPIKENFSLSISPNPANGFAILKTDAFNQNASFFLFSASGQKIMQSIIVEERTLLDLSKCNMGVYFLKVESDLGTVVRKFIVK